MWYNLASKINLQILFYSMFFYYIWLWLYSTQIVGKSVGYEEECESGSVNDKEQQVQINWVGRYLRVNRWDLSSRSHANTLQIDQDDNVEEEGEENQDDATENPNGKGSQSGGVGGGFR